ncbi:MAG: YheU family protein [Porticoccaceae bacterium]|nr:YheU family protein [Porticoccaceae bacterium]MDG1310901.1 YheU family protein [Porticoccaceae bacterium]
MIEIPANRLSAEILTAIIEEFILREGTDYGAQEAGMDNKIAQVHRQLARGDVLITFDPATENCTLLTKHQFQRYSMGGAQQGSDEKLSSQSSAAAYEDYSQDTGNNLD